MDKIRLRFTQQPETFVSTCFLISNLAAECSCSSGGRAGCLLKVSSLIPGSSALHVEESSGKILNPNLLSMAVLSVCVWVCVCVCVCEFLMSRLILCREATLPLRFECVNADWCYKVFWVFKSPVLYKCQPFAIFPSLTSPIKQLHLMCRSQSEWHRTQDFN